MNRTINILGFLLPLELVFSMGVHGVLSGEIGSAYKIFQLQTVIFLVLVIFFLGKRLRVEKRMIAATSAFLSIGVLELWMTLINDAQVGLAVAQLFFGFVFPSCLVICVACSLDEQKKFEFFKAFYFGYTFFLFVAIFFAIFIDDSLHALYSNYGIEGALISFRFNGADQLFHLLLGNTNKQSNYLIILMALSPILLGIRSNHPCDVRESRSLAFVAFVSISAVCILLMFSRAAVFLLFGVLLLLMPTLPVFLKRLLQLCFFLISITFLFRLIFESDSPSLLGYLLNSTYIDGTSTGVFGTIGERADIFNFYLDNIIDLRSIFFGIGVGSFGIRWDSDPNVTAHNLYIHHLATSGIVVWLLLFLITAAGFFCAILRKDRLLIFAWVSFLILSYRDYSFSDLYVSSMGGLVYMLLLASTYCYRGSAKIHQSKTVKLKLTK